MLSSFGKKKSSSGVMYCIKRTKVGKRVVKVETVTRRGKKVKVYASTRKSVPSSVKCFTRKTQAQAFLNSSKMSSFGRSRKSQNVASKKVKTKYGYTACNDVNGESFNGKKYKVYKFRVVKHNMETFRIVTIRTNGSTEYFKLPDEQELKGFLVRTSGTESQIKESDRKARGLAKKMCEDFEQLGGINIQLVHCSVNGEDVDGDRSGGSNKDLSHRAFLRSIGAPVRTQEQATKMFEYAGNQSNQFLHRLRASRQLAGPNASIMGRSGRDLDALFAERGASLYKLGPLTPSGRVPLGRNRFNPLTKSSRSSFGNRRINYGFSKYF